MILLNPPVQMWVGRRRKEEDSPTSKHQRKTAGLTSKGGGAWGRGRREEGDSLTWDRDLSLRSRIQVHSAPDLIRYLWARQMLLDQLLLLSGSPALTGGTQTSRKQREYRNMTPEHSCCSVPDSEILISEYRWNAACWGGLPGVDPGTSQLRLEHPES